MESSVKYRVPIIPFVIGVAICWCQCFLKQQYVLLYELKIKNCIHKTPIFARIRDQTKDRFKGHLGRNLFRRPSIRSRNFAILSKCSLAFQIQAASSSLPLAWIRLSQVSRYLEPNLDFLPLFITCYLNIPLCQTLSCLLKGFEVTGYYCTAT